MKKGSRENWKENYIMKKNKEKKSYGIRKN
jgi:hypothetical protein